MTEQDLASEKLKKKKNAEKRDSFGWEEGNPGIHEQ